MKPLSPPVPKSHLASRAGCFGPSSIPQSPSETCLPWSGKAPARADRHINVVDALLESRMTEAEIKRLSLDSSHRQHKRMSSSTMAMAATSPSTRKSSSFSDNINTPRPEAVHFAEPGPYWAGRYMTITGRLRQEGMNDNADMPLRPSGSQERLSSRSDDQRMKRALSELRSCCRTSPALQSFELFEKSLKKSLSVPSGTKVEAKKLSNSMTMPQIAPVTAAGSTAKRVQCERAKTPPTVVRVLDDEALNKNRRRSARKSNGDLVKGVLDASLKQVRLMGKLVGDGVSWMGSQEDLDIKVFATHAK
ncbi:hypothetical protein DV738_g728, partial [Chaetothyriales sp. CBS 135597]